MFKLSSAAHRHGVWLLGAAILVGLSSCASKPVSSAATQNICDIFREKPSWYRNANKSVERWGGNLHVPMAIIYQESSFKSDARPPMGYFLGLIPTGRASNAYGYSQALTSTWGEYEKAIGSSAANRDDFSDAFDFVLWYMDVTYQRNEVSKWDPQAHYLNYHEGQGGFARGSHNAKPWLLKVAARVSARSSRYAGQLSQCKAELDNANDGWF